MHAEVCKFTNRGLTATTWKRRTTPLHAPGTQEKKKKKKPISLGHDAPKAKIFVGCARLAHQRPGHVRRGALGTKPEGLRDVRPKHATFLQRIERLVGGFMNLLFFFAIVREDYRYDGRGLLDTQCELKNILHNPYHTGLIRFKLSLQYGMQLSNVYIWSMNIYTSIYSYIYIYSKLYICVNRYTHIHVNIHACKGIYLYILAVEMHWFRREAHNLVTHTIMIANWLQVSCWRDTE